MEKIFEIAPEFPSPRTGGIDINNFFCHSTNF